MSRVRRHHLADGDGGEDRWYRIEHRTGDRVRVVGRLPNVFPHHSTLRPFLSRLLQEGVLAGELVLVDEARRQDVARRRVSVPRQPAPTGCD